MCNLIKKRIIALILAGGQGSRLKLLTRNVAKPAVAFGGKYRIIDFVLSNCSNSGIDTVGVLTQYKPQILNGHIGIGSPWDLDRIHGGVHMLPPYQTEEGGDWYKGTANAVYQNLPFCDEYDPDYILILSGDHIYKMDYSQMLDYHVKKDADATIAVIEVPIEEASRFGIMNTDEYDSIVEFEEKPDNPKSNLASMGIYIFNYPKLKKYLIQDAKDVKSDYDFGKNIIPKMLHDSLSRGEKNKMYAYTFNGYWKDVGTIESLWEANMDIINTDVETSILNPSWPIYSQIMSRPPQYVGKHAQIENSLVSEGCVINGQVINSVIFPGVRVEEGTRIINSIIMSDSVIERNVIVDKAILSSRATIKANTVVGNSKNIALIDEGEVVASNTIV